MGIERRRSLVLGTVVALAATACLQSAPAAAADDPAATNEAVVSAAADYVPGDADSAAALAAAASPIDAIALTESGNGTTVSHGSNDEAPTLRVGPDGQAVTSSPGLPEISVSIPQNETQDAVLSNGALVHPQGLSDTDVVTRATALGGQIIAVLGTEDADTSLDFQFGLPEDATLHTQTDGSIVVTGPVTSEVLPEEELERVTSAVDEVFGDASADDAAVTDEQQEAIDAIPEAEWEEVTQEESIMTIAPAWAVDANGDPVETRYEVEGNTVTQIVETDENTAFPVTADPSWWWWAGTAAGCISEIGGFLFVSWKLAKAFTKIESLMKKSARLTAVIKRLGGIKKSLTTVYNAAKGIARGSIKKYTTASQRSALKDFVKYGSAVFIGALGLGKCYALIKEAT